MRFRRIQHTIIPPNSLWSKVMQRLVNSAILLFSRIVKKQNMDADIALIRSSDLFDASWYINNNPDVANANLDPAFHYLYYGSFEGRDPGPNFSSKAYLETYDDIKKAGINPLVHFLRNGKQEGRIAYPLLKIDFSKPFVSSYIKEVTSSLQNRHEDNYDIHSFGTRLQNKDVPVSETTQNIFTATEFVKPYWSHFEWLYGKLDEDQSQEILVKLLAFRALGYQRVKLPLNTPAYWNDIKKMEELADPTDSLYVNFLGSDWQIFLMDLNKIGIPVKFYSSPLGVYQDFVLEQYRCKEIVVEPGDYVIDAGACWGETALYFARLAEESGCIFSYEFVPENLNILHQNLALNPEIGKNVQIIEKAAWNKSDVSLNFNTNGPASRVDKKQTNNTLMHTLTLSIDDLVVRENLPKLDFIKMDIEGAELPALQGAAQTLIRFKPKLAIAVYHNLTDLFEIPEYLDSLGIGYRFFLRHYTIQSTETVLYAMVN